jgi:sugar lactone lactonase YvrE
MANYGININVAPNDSFAFNNSLCNDVIFYSSNSSQHILIGSAIGFNSALLINSNNIWANKFGINNSNPLSALDVIGDINFTGNLYRSNILFTASVWSNNSSNLFISSNLGINKSNPLYALDINGNVNINSNIYLNGLPYMTPLWFSNASTNIYINSNIGINKSNIVSTLDIGGDLNYDGLLRQNGSAYNIPYNNGTPWSNVGSNVYVINNLSLGTSNSSNTLNIAGTVNTTSNITVSGILLTNGLCITPANGGQANSSSSIIVGISNGNNFLSSNQFYFMIGSNTIMTIASNSFIGIGTSNPQYNLDIVGDINIQGSLLQNTFNILNQWTTSNYNTFIIGSNIGIGLSNPITSLDINGNLNISSNLYINGILSVSNYENISGNININNSETIQSNLIVYSNATLCNSLNTYNSFITTNILPTSNLTYNLGSANMRFNTIYLSSNTINMGSVILTADPNTGGLRILNSNNSNANLIVKQINIGSVALTASNNTVNYISSNVTTIGGGWSNNSTTSNVAIGKSNALYQLDVSGTVNASSILINTKPIFQSYIIAVDSNNSSVLNSNYTWSIISSKSNIYFPISSISLNNSTTNKVAIDCNNNYYAIGSYSNAFLNGIINLSSTNSSYITQFSCNNNLNWLSTISSSILNSIKIDYNQNIIIHGTYSNLQNINSIALASPNIVSKLPISLSNSSFILKMNSNGTPIWNNYLNNAIINNICIDTSNNILVVGSGGSNVYDVNINSTNALYASTQYSITTTILSNLNNPMGFSIDSFGNFYVSDATTNIIKKIDVLGNISIFAGSGTATYLDGTGSLASFNSPHGLCIDSSNNLYVADTSNNRIRKIDNNSIVTTIAGNGTATYVNSNTSNSSFYSPTALAIDNSNNIYVADTNNNVIRLISNANVSTYAGTGTATFLDSSNLISGFNKPMGIILDTSNNLYIADTYNNRIRKLTKSNNMVTTYAGNGSAAFTNGTATSSAFNYPIGLSIDLNGNMYIGDTSNNRIRVINSNGNVNLLAGNGSYAYSDGITASFYSPSATITDIYGNLYITDSNRLRRIETGGVSVNTIAGSGTATYLDGIGLVSGFNKLTNIAIDLNNNIYICDTSNNRIRLLNNNGVISTLAGSGTATYLDGASNLAGFNSPTAICVDLSNNVYVADNSNNRIRKISNGIVTTFAGSGTATFFNGTGTLAGFNSVYGLIADNNYNIYVADTSNNLIRKITNQVVTTYAGSGTATYLDSSNLSAGFNKPIALSIDLLGNLYCADSSNFRIRKITTNSVSTIAGSGTSTLFNSFGTLAGFSNITSLAVDVYGNINVCDSGNNIIRKIHTNGLVSTLCGSGTATFIDGYNSNVGFNVPYGLIIDNLNNMYISDNLRIRKLSYPYLASSYVGSGTSTYLDSIGTMASFLNISGITIDSSNNIYACDNHRIRKITNGIVTTISGTGTATYFDANGTLAGFNTPSGLICDSSNNLYVADTNNNVIRKITSNGVVSTIAGSRTATYLDGNGTLASFNKCLNLCIDSNNNLYVADTGNNRIRKITSNGIVSTIAGSGTASYLDGAGTLACFNAPTGICIDINGNLYVSEWTNARIRKINTSGTVSTFAGNGTNTFINSNGTFSSFFYPLCMTTDNLGNLYVADKGNNLIRKITTSGFVSTVIGSGVSVLTNGTGTNASFASIYGICLDSNNNIYVSDQSVLRKISPLSTYGLNTSLNLNSNLLTSNSFYIKYNSSGITQNVIGFSNNFNTITCDMNQNIYLAGNSNLIKLNSWNVSLSNKVNTLTSDKTSNLYLVSSNNLSSYNLSGNLRWSSNINLADAIVDSNNFIYTVGAGFMYKFDSNVNFISSFNISNSFSNTVAVSLNGCNVIIGGDISASTIVYDGNNYGGWITLSSNSSCFAVNYLQMYSSNIYLPANLGGICAQKYITNIGLCNLLVNITSSNNLVIMSSNILYPSSNTLYNYFGNNWYKQI